MKRNRKILAVFCIILTASLLTYAFATILYSLIIPSTWNVSTSQGLELDYSNGSKVTSLTWSVSPLGNETQNLILKNLANHAVNVTSVIPAGTAQYSFTTTFVNNTIAQSGTYAFSITLIDLGMDSTTTYSGNFNFYIVDHFDLGNDSFGTSAVNYASDSSQYFNFVSDGFNSTNYQPSDMVLYHFTTENINQTYDIQGLTYKLEVLDGSNNVVSTVCDGLTVAYYQDSTHYGTFGNGTHMTDQPLMPNGTLTIWNSFLAPSPSATYHLGVTYQSHNSALIQQNIAWNFAFNALYTPYYETFSSPSVDTTTPNTQATLTYAWTGKHLSTYTEIGLVITISNGQTIFNGTQTGTYQCSSSGNTYWFNFTFTTPTQAQPYTITIQETSLS